MQKLKVSRSAGNQELLKRPCLNYCSLFIYLFIYLFFVSGEVAEDIMWYNHVWPALPGNEGQLEPRYTNADYLHHLDPDVKVIVILRDPTER